MKNITNYLALGAVALGLTGAAQAVPTLKLIQGATTVIVSDNGLGVGPNADSGGTDSSAVLGAVAFNGSVGAYVVNVSTGITKPLQGSSASPFMDLNSVDVGVGTLTLMFSETGFTQLGSALALIGGTSNGTISYSTYWSASNALFATDNLLTTQSFGSGAFSGTRTGGPTSGQPYSLTQVVTITHNSLTTSSFDAQLTVPDSGSTIALLGAALATLGLISRRRKVA